MSKYDLPKKFDYKDVNTLKQFITETGKIIPARVTGVSASNQRKLTKNIKIARSLVGNYCTSLEMQGASVTLTKLDQELVKHWDSAVHTAAMRWGM